MTGRLGMTGSAVGRGDRAVGKLDTTMSDADAYRVAARYDTRGPLPKTLDRAARMKAYEGRYIASGGRKAEKWKRRATGAEVGRNVGLGAATASAAGILALRGKHTGPLLRRAKMSQGRLEGTGLAAAVGGGSSELYGEYARHRRASYQNSPAGVAASSLSRMRAYTPGRTT